MNQHQLRRLVERLDILVADEDPSFEDRIDLTDELRRALAELQERRHVAGDPDNLEGLGRFEG